MFKVKQLRPNLIETELNRKIVKTLNYDERWDPTKKFIIDTYNNYIKPHQAIIIFIFFIILFLLYRYRYTMNKREEEQNDTETENSIE